VLVLTLGVSAQAAVAASVGMVTKVENQAQVGGAKAVVGTLVQANDQLSTGPKSRLEVTFRDKTTVTLGENATLVVDRYVFNPEQSTGELLVSSSVGAFRMATGRLNEMRNKKINASTPYAALAVRGTDFWWGPISDHAATLLVSNSSVAVSNDRERCTPEEERRGRCSCAVTLTQSGQVTDIKPECPEGLRSKDPRCWSCPGPPRAATAAEISAALSQTQFGLASLGSTVGSVAAAAGIAGAVVGANAAVANKKEKNINFVTTPASP